MTTLFLVPNDNPPLARRFEQRIGAAGGVPGGWEVRCVPKAPHVIASPQDDLRAAAAADAFVCAHETAWSQVVLMSSVDSGYEEIRRHAGIAALGFTRCVLGLHRSQGQRLQAVTFGSAMTARYQRIFEDEACAGVVRHHTGLDVSPASLSASPTAEVQALARLCDVRHAASGERVFLVGAMALDLADGLRSDSRAWIVDPVADLLAYLRHQRALRSSTRH